jgi:hydroxyacylglutathione hydrolase
MVHDRLVSLRLSDFLHDCEPARRGNLTFERIVSHPMGARNETGTKADPENRSIYVFKWGIRVLRKLVVGPYQSNCYILACKETLEGAVIDPGDEVLRIVKELSRNRIQVRFILITHGHIDHIGGASELKRITRAPVLIHPYDAPALHFTPDGSLEEGMQLRVGTYTVSVIHTPGHSAGGVCFLSPGAVFTGDTLFAGSVGRTDFPGGSHESLVAGVKAKIFPLGDDLRIYPGHGPSSTVGHERRTNPFFQPYSRTW